MACHRCGFRRCGLPGDVLGASRRSAKSRGRARGGGRRISYACLDRGRRTPRGLPEHPHGPPSARVIAIPPRVIAIPPRAIAIPPRVIAIPPRVIAIPPRVIAIPQRVIAIPQRVIAIPQRVIAIPRRVIAIPRRVIAIPRRVIAIPRRVIAIPQRVIAIPRRVIAIPRRVIAIPRRVIAIPRRAIAIPRRVIAIPPRVIAIPRRRQLHPWTVARRLVPEKMGQPSVWNLGLGSGSGLALREPLSPCRRSPARAGFARFSGPGRRGMPRTRRP